jgi:hypothetical protein
MRMAAQEVLRPVVAPKFGESVIIQAEFVAKPNDYYSQNIVPEPYILSVISVDGMKLKAPVLIEYMLEVGKKDHSQLERLGATFTFEAYETVHQTGRPGPWMEEMEQGRGFVLENLLHIRPVKRRANQPPETTSPVVTPAAAQPARQP